MLNQARLKVLKARDDHVGQVLDNAKTQLVTISKDGNKYPQLLEGLIGQVRYIIFLPNKSTVLKSSVSFKLFVSIIDAEFCIE